MTGLIVAQDGQNAGIGQPFIGPWYLDLLAAFLTFREHARKPRVYREPVPIWANTKDRHSSPSRSEFFSFCGPSDAEHC